MPDEPGAQTAARPSANRLLLALKASADRDVRTLESMHYAHLAAHQDAQQALEQARTTAEQYSGQLAAATDALSAHLADSDQAGIHLTRRDITITDPADAGRALIEELLRQVADEFGWFERWASETVPIARIAGVDVRATIDFDEDLVTLVPGEVTSLGIVLSFDQLARQDRESYTLVPNVEQGTRTIVEIAERITTLPPHTAQLAAAMRGALTEVDQLSAARPVFGHEDALTWARDRASRFAEALTGPSAPNDADGVWSAPSATDIDPHRPFAGFSDNVLTDENNRAAHTRYTIGELLRGWTRMTTDELDVTAHAIDPHLGDLHDAVLDYQFARRAVLAAQPLREQVDDQQDALAEAERRPSADEHARVNAMAEEIWREERDARSRAGVALLLAGPPDGHVAIEARWSTLLSDIVAAGNDVQGSAADPMRRRAASAAATEFGLADERNLRWLASRGSALTDSAAASRRSVLAAVDTGLPWERAVDALILAQRTREETENADPRTRRGEIDKAARAAFPDLAAAWAADESADPELDRRWKEAVEQVTREERAMWGEQKDEADRAVTVALHTVSVHNAISLARHLADPTGTSSQAATVPGPRRAPAASATRAYDPFSLEALGMDSLTGAPLPEPVSALSEPPF